MFKIKPIKSESDYEKALVQLRKLKLRNADKDTEEYNLREVLKVLVGNFEKEQDPFEQANFDHWIDFMQKNGHSEKTLQEFREAEQLINAEDKFEEMRIKFIRQKLKEKSLKQNDLVNIIGVDKSYVSQLMNGKKNFTVPIISKLYYYLDIPYELLIPPAHTFNNVNGEEE
jgi:antitoxin component HigA of HigAB toxin-antitoxin module